MPVERTINPDMQDNPIPSTSTGIADGSTGHIPIMPDEDEPLIDIFKRADERKAKEQGRKVARQMVHAFMTPELIRQCVLGDINGYKTGVINDPLGQPTVPAGSDCRLILKFWDGRTDTLV